MTELIPIALALGKELYDLLVQMHQNGADSEKIKASMLASLDKAKQAIGDLPAQLQGNDAAADAAAK